MKKLNLHDMYDFGRKLTPLSNIQPHLKVKAHAVDLWWAKLSLEAMTRPESPLLETARRAAHKLLSAINETIPDDLANMFGMDDTKIFDYRGVKIKESLSQLESVLGNDMPGIAAYLVSKKGIFNTDDLINNAECYFPQKTRYELPEQAHNDLREAGKCLAYELPTACVFHLWRAVETVMLEYLQKLINKKLMSNNKNWSAYINALTEANADKKITAFLDHIRTQYRNPQTHPEEMVEIGEAQQLFGAAMSSINQMLDAINKLRESRVQPQSVDFMPVVKSMLNTPIQ